ncbi:MAG: hypothetical protein E7042_00385 [Lentisphaerae bacterium]|nr:hypothetical protein [Lentisphaerota bacterium]
MMFLKKALFLLTAIFCIAVFADEFVSPVLREEWREEVLKSLDLDFPGLEKVKALYLANDKKAASFEFVKYLRAKKQPASYLNSLASYDKSRAAQGLNYTYTYGKTSHCFPNKKIDWFFNKTRESGRLDYEWQWQLNRMPWFPAMAGAYLKSGNKEYVIAFVRQLRSWAAACHQVPEHSGNRPDSAWRGITCGLRLYRFWPPAYVAFIKANEFTDDDVLTYCYLTLLQSRHLKKYNNTGNILTMEMRGLFTFGAMFPEFKESAEARKYAVKTLYNSAKNMLLEDGFLNELTTGYHRLVVANVYELATLADECGVKKELPKDFVTLLEKSFEALLKMATPAFDAPLTNDSGHSRLVSFFAPAAKLFPHRKDFLWVQSNRKKGGAPDYLSTVLPWSGLVIMRGSWEHDASYLVFDVGPLGVRHAHQDKLNIAIWRGQDQLLYDDGGGNYAKTESRKYTISSYAHNLVTVDGLPQVTSASMKNRRLSNPVSGNFKSDGKVDYASGIFDQGWGSSGNRIVRQERQVLFLRPNIFLVLDRMIPTKRGAKKPHVYQARWHVDTLKMSPVLDGNPALISSPESSIELPKMRGNPSGKRAKLIVAPLFTEGLSVKQLTGQDKGKCNELAGLFAFHPYRATTTVMHERAGAGEVRFLTMFVTLGNKEISPLKSIRQTGIDSAEVLFNDGRKLEVSVVKNVLKAIIKN